MQKLYSVSEMLLEANARFKLKNYYDDSSAYNMQFRRILKSSGIWEKGINADEIKTENNYKKNERLFTKSQMEDLFAEERIYDYLRKYSTLDEYKNAPKYKDAVKEIKKRRENYIDYLDEREKDNESYDGIPYISKEELTSKKNSLMIEAIFNLLFTNFDTDLYEHDLSAVLCSDELGLTPKIIEAEKRLSNPNGSYFKLKPAIKKKLEQK